VICVTCCIADKQAVSSIGIRGVFFWNWTISYCIMFDSDIIYKIVLFVTHNTTPI